jgi:hypothetical protein
MLLFLSLLGLAFASAAEPRPWLAPGQPVAARVASLLAAMTLEEKVAQLNYDCVNLVWNTTSFRTTGIGSVGEQRCCHCLVVVFEIRKESDLTH